MYPTLYDAIKDLFGFDWLFLKLFPSFGFFVALAFLIPAYVLAAELKRKEREGLLKSSRKKILEGAPASFSELITTGIFGFIIGYKLFFIFFNYAEFSSDPRSNLLSTKGNVWGGIILASVMAWMQYREKEKQKLEKPVWKEVEVHPYQLISNITIVAAISGIIGAKIFHNLENIDEFIADPWGSIFSASGLTFYGGLICGAISVLYYAHTHHIKPIHLLDASAPALMLAYGIGRIGCQVAGDGDWGIPNDHPMPSWLGFLPEWVWAYDYPHNVLGWNLKEQFLQDGYLSITGKAWPTPLYEAIAGILLFFVLYAIRKKISIPGQLFSFYLILTGVERFFIEKIRINSIYHILSYKITQAEIISVMLVILGIYGLWYCKKKTTARHV